MATATTNRAVNTLEFQRQHWPDENASRGRTLAQAMAEGTLFEIRAWRGEYRRPEYRPGYLSACFPSAQTWQTALAYCFSHSGPPEADYQIDVYQITGGRIGCYMVRPYLKGLRVVDGRLIFPETEPEEPADPDYLIKFFRT